ncbi:MAG: ABC transporter ATP-binding protein [Flavobacteriaceae bacterium]|nr:ABC transporter ATP-binding protein [Flavobacteriaceae bacterium]MCY4216649.1 ABC transporter ATP-binding protein [Flavobacteriaceae bacterium]MCY4253858.1 ABC transporter ATP-binding protein [Flavobacteriaceae bacterium]
MKLLKRILAFGSPYKGYVALNILFNFLYAVFSGLAFISLIPMLDVLFATNQSQTTPPVYTGIDHLTSYLKSYMDYYIHENFDQNTSHLLVFVIAVVLVTFLLKNLCNYLALFFITFLRNGILRDLRNKLYHKIIHLPVSYFSEKKKGDLISRMTHDVNEVQVSFLSMLEVLVRDPLTILFSIFFMLTISIKLTIVVLIFIPISGFLITQIGKRLKKDSDLLQKQQGRFMSIMDETIVGQPVIKSFQAENKFIHLFITATKRFYRFSNRFFHRANLASPMSEFLGICTIGVLLWIGGQEVLNSTTLSGAFFISYMGLAYNILTPAKNISKAYYSLRKADAAGERIFEILDIPSRKDHAMSVSKSDFERHIRFENVHFKYRDQWVLKDLSFSIKKGQMVALVGSSGSGKTTIANILLGFQSIQKGHLKIDGVPIEKIKRCSLYQMIGSVDQQPILFHDTVANNLKIGKPHARKEELIAAAKVANAHEFIQQLPHQYHSNIGEGADRLSGGQKQRLCITRAVVKNPDILILDEATSSLDTESEKLVQQALEKLMKGRTSLVIAHRLSTVVKADKILVLDKGTIVESGTHSELIKKQSLYKKLVDLQNLT